MCVCVCVCVCVCGTSNHLSLSFSLSLSLSLSLLSSLPLSLPPSLPPSLSRSLQHVLECQNQEELDDLTAHFTVDLASFGSVRTVELEEGGMWKKVTVDNRKGYVYKLAQFYLTGWLRRWEGLIERIRELK